MTETLSLGGRYKVSLEEVLGEGSFSVVYKGVDVKTSGNVAVKIYKDGEDESTVASFKHNIEVVRVLSSNRGRLTKAAVRRCSKDSFDGEAFCEEFEQSSGRQVDGGASPKMEPVLEFMDLKACFVQILDYSRSSDGTPGKDEYGELYLVMELGYESLKDWFASLSQEGKSLSKDQLRELQWTLVSIVAGMHTKGLVHLDVKPNNVVRFESGGRSLWKLIDLDGAVQSGGRIDLDNITLTPKYMPPEIAQTFGDEQREQELLLSRRMDVWSVGMCALEAIFLQPILGPWYDQWREETGSDDKFYLWLADFDTDPVLSGDIVDHLRDIDPDMCSLLQGMLTKDPQKRLCIANCWAHRWFQPLREKMLNAAMAKAERNNAGKDAIWQPLPSKESRRRSWSLGRRHSGSHDAVGRTFTTSSSSGTSSLMCDLM